MLDETSTVQVVGLSSQLNLEKQSMPAKLANRIVNNRPLINESGSISRKEK